MSAVEDGSWDLAAYEVHETLLTDLVSTTCRATAARDSGAVRAGHDVALRVVSPSLSGSARAVKGFLAANERVAAIDHPHVLRVVDATVDQGAAVVASVWREGRALADLLLESAPLDPREVLRLGGQLAEALDTVHDHGLTHGSIGPGTVWIRQRAGSRIPPAAALTGFGSTWLLRQIVSEIDAQPASVDLLFVAPEQVRGHAASPATDQYALACLLFTALTGTTPFRGETHHALFSAHLSDGVPSATAVRADLAAGWDDVFARALAKEPADRFTNCRTLLLEAGRSAAQGPRTQAPAGARPRRHAGDAPQPASPADMPEHASPTTPSPSTRAHARPAERSPVARWAVLIVLLVTLILVVVAAVLGFSRGVFTAGSADTPDTPVAGHATLT